MDVKGTADSVMFSPSPRSNMNLRLAASLLGLTMSALLAGLFSVAGAITAADALPQDSENHLREPANADHLTSPSPASNVNITLTANGFIPADLTTTLGTSVVWYNATAQAQVLKSGSPFDLFLPLVVRGGSNLSSASATRYEPFVAQPVAKADQFSATLAVGGTFMFTPSDVGTIRYFAASMPRWRGRVIVQLAIPPNPTTVAPPIDPSATTNLCTATKFIYTGTVPIQTGVAPNTIDCKSAAVL